MRRIVAKIVIAACIATALQMPPVHAQTLYECASKAGNSYQQSPCAGPTRTVRTMEVAPEPAPTASQLAAKARKAEQDRAESAFLSHLAGTDQASIAYRSPRYRRSSTGSGRTTHGDACRLAKAARTSMQQIVGAAKADCLQACEGGPDVDAAGSRPWPHLRSAAQAR